MAKVECEVDFDEVEGENGRMIPGCNVTCGKCGAVEESFGQGPGSVRRCFALLRENCPGQEKNFYVAEDGSDED